ncbi:hypothetical protein [Dyadobacter sp. CY351]|uniref:hypothetical protein n=1 Tax=Dyadobacter sp. CY351 TaxID=2909337 RepID=UPI001F367F30|nr:hypothetical protein [Dyadobacter sp. CY351]MCF2517131.1 hypothetical protein [Dyadobacter sp. CY351]
MPKFKYKVLKNFRDSQNDYAFHGTDEEIFLPVQRAEELAKLGYVDKTPIPAKTKDAPDKASVDGESNAAVKSKIEKEFKA